MTAPAVSCVIVAFHRPESLTALLEGLKADDLERIVVNVENDDAVAGVAAAQGARTVPVDRNVGYAAGVNLGVASATAPVVVFMNDDLSVEADAVRVLCSTVASGSPGVAVPRLVAPGGENELTVAALPTPWTLALEWMALPDMPVPWLRRWVHPEKWRTPTARESISAAMASIVAAPRWLLVAEPLPDVYFLYWEESEWFWRLGRRGVEVVYEPAATAVHHGGRQDVRPEKSRLLARNAVRCVRRTQGRWAAGAAWVVVIGWNLRLTLVEAFRFRKVGVDRSRMGARVAGLRAALGAVTELK